MPIEYEQLAGTPWPWPMEECPKCGFTTAYDFQRGCVQRHKRKWGFLWKQDYCAVICAKCKEILGWESPPVDYGQVILREVQSELRKQGIKSYWGIQSNVVGSTLNITFHPMWIVYNYSSAAIEINTTENRAVENLCGPIINMPDRDVYAFEMYKEGAIDDVVAAVKRFRERKPRLTRMYETILGLFSYKFSWFSLGWVLMWVLG